MSDLLNHPLSIFAITLVMQWCAAYAGDFARSRRTAGDLEGEDLSTILTATLTLLGLVIGFSFSMAISRYDQRKNYEEAEANAIGTEYVRADLLPTADAAALREALRKYTDRRISFYKARNQGEVDHINGETDRLQTQLWSIVTRQARKEPTPVMALAVAGMNDVLNSQGYTQAAWWNRIPVAAWELMGMVAVCANLLLGFSEQRRSKIILLVLPVIMSLAFFLIADVDSPRGGVIRVLPQNLTALRQSLTAP
jgi:lipopolysaccharide export LptBFGC system permease protein LptF